jgi:NIMA (never in mitosis gene a)-related kinase
LRATGELHNRNILHRDIKPENVFLDVNQVVKLGDLGIAKQMSTPFQQSKTFAGTFSYMAPELFGSTKWTLKADVWALGILLYELCMLQVPYSSIAEILQDPPAQIDEGYSENL